MFEATKRYADLQMFRSPKTMGVCSVRPAERRLLVEWQFSPLSPYIVVFSCVTIVLRLLILLVYSHHCLQNTIRCRCEYALKTAIVTISSVLSGHIEQERKRAKENEETTARLRSFFPFFRHTHTFYSTSESARARSAASSAVFNSMREEEQLHFLRCSIFAAKSILDHSSSRLVHMPVNWMWQWLMVSINIEEGRLNIVWWQRETGTQRERGRKKASN